MAVTTEGSQAHGEPRLHLLNQASNRPSHFAPGNALAPGAGENANAECGFDINICAG